jgi:hypothetical protein
VAFGYFRLNNITIKDIPAPDLSDSYSYNEKLEFLRKHPRNADIITVGSSLSLNNLDSKTITEELQSKSYLNLSSWGMSMKDIFLLLKMQSEIHVPRVLIVASGIMDFQATEKNVKYSVVRDFLRSDNSAQIFYHLKCFNLKYYISNFKYARKVRSIPNSYDYLGYDDYGTINIGKKDFRISELRWKKDYLNAKLSQVQYAYLDSISVFCKKNEIKFLFFQSPYRKGLYSNFDSAKLKLLTDHISKVESILGSYQHTFINANNSLWDDDLFIDGTHFSAEGAKLFTKYCFENWKGLEIVKAANVAEKIAAIDNATK